MKGKVMVSAPGGHQSMNVGLREAADLAGLYADVLEGRETRDSLAGYGAARLNEWRFLLGLDSEAKESPTRSWLTKRQLVSAVPASGATLHRILEQLDLPRE